MTYVKIDDDIFRNPKVVRVSTVAKLIYVASICYCGNQLTDGFIPRNAARTLSADAGVNYSPKIVKELINAGLWLESEDGYTIHDYLEHNESAEKVHAKKEAARKRMERLRSGDVRANNQRTHGEVRDTDTTTDTSPNGEDIPPTPKRNRKKSQTLTPEQMTRFERWYSVFPRKVNRAKAEEKWAEIDPDDDLTDVMVSKTEEWSASPDWTKNGGQYVPHPATWLHNKRWTDGSPSQASDAPGSLRDVSRTRPLSEITDPRDIIPGPRGYTTDQLRRKSELERNKLEQERLRATS